MPNNSGELERRLGRGSARCSGKRALSRGKEARRRKGPSLKI